MSELPNTLFLRLESPLQAWGSHEGKFALRRTSDTPTKSGVCGLICAALGVSRTLAADYWLPELNKLRLGIRIDRAGFRMWDFHTAGAGLEMRTSELSEPKNLKDVGAERESRVLPKDLKFKHTTHLSRREYLADASFLVALQGNPEIVETLARALKSPVWAIYLGRKNCPPGRPVWEHPPGSFASLEDALAAIPIQIRQHNDPVPNRLECVLDWIPAYDGEPAPEDAEIHYDLPVSFQPPRHLPRFVIRQELVLSSEPETQRVPVGKAWRPPRNRADYANTKYKEVRAERLVMDSGLCMVCKAPATTVQHVDYRRAGGNEQPDDLRALCRLCHDACTMLEYGSGMTMDRIDPCDPTWRERILAKREEIVSFRSLQQRRRKLDPKEENG